MHDGVGVGEIQSVLSLQRHLPESTDFLISSKCSQSYLAFLLLLESTNNTSSFVSRALLRAVGTTNVWHSMSVSPFLKVSSTRIPRSRS